MFFRPREKGRPAPRLLRLAALCALALCAPVLAQAVDVRGVVLDRSDDSPVSYAKIRFESGKELATADRQGRFEAEVPAKGAKLRAEKPGYETLSFSLDDYPDPLDLQVFLIKYP